jgi:hypothetical protein
LAAARLSSKRVLPDRAFVKTVCPLRSPRSAAPELRDAFVDGGIGRCGDLVVLDYRLNMMTRNAGV